MSKGKALLKSTMIYGIGSLGTRVLGFALLPFYTAVFTPSDYGYIDLFMTGSILMITVVSMKLFDGAYRFLWDTPDPALKSEIISSVLNLTLLNFVVVSAIGWGAARFFDLDIPLAALVFVNLIIRIPADYFQQVTRALGKSHLYSISGVIVATVTVALNILLLYVYHFGVVGYLVSMAVAYSFCVVYCYMAGSLGDYYRLRWPSMAVLKPLLAYSLPLLPAAVSWWFIRLSGRYVLSEQHDLDQVGIFAVSDKLPAVLYMVNMTFYMAWQDIVIKHFHDEDRDRFLSNVLGTYVRLGLSVVVMITLFLKPFFQYMINERFHQAHVYVPWLLLAVFFLSLGGLYDVFFMGSKKTMGVLYSTVVAAALNVVLCIAFVPKFGIWATTLSTLAAAVALLVFRVVQFRRRINIRYPFGRMTLLIGSTVVAAYCFDLEGWRYVLAAVMLTCVVLETNRHDLRSLLAMARNRLQAA